MTRPNTEHGDRETALSNEILRTTVGSGVHGIAIEGTDDRDEMGIYIEPRENVYGLKLPLDHYVWRTQPEGVRSGPGDIDLVCYSLRKYLRLAVKGNPTALLPLFAPEVDVLISTRIGDSLREMRTVFLSQESVYRFLGYMAEQHSRMLGGGKRNRVPNRPELVEKYGYDVKFAAHALRLAIQGWEVAATGGLSLPMLPASREMVLQVKRGEWPQGQVSRVISELEEITRKLLESGGCPLPEKPFMPLISKWSIEAHERHWFHNRSNQRKAS